MGEVVRLFPMKVYDLIEDEFTNRTHSDIDLRERFGLFIPGDKATATHKAIAEDFFVMARYLDHVLPNKTPQSCRAKSIALTELETAFMWAQKAINEMSSMATNTGGE